MKIKKTIVMFACAFAAACAFAGHGEVPPYPNFGLPRTEEMMFLVLQIGVIIFAAKLGGMLASLARLPSILGELGAGIVIGPWALGGIGFGDGLFASGLFHGAALRDIAASTGVAFDAASPALYGIATLASVILLFLSGLETNLKMFLKYSFVGSMVGVGGVLVSFVFGDLCAVYLLPEFFEHFAFLKGLPLAEAMTREAPLYMGIMSTATSVGITARILSEKKKMDSEEGTTIMAGAVIDDVLGLIVLAIGNGIIAANAAMATSGGEGPGMDWGAIGIVAVKAFGVWLGATVIGVFAARKISAFLKKSFRSPVVIATMAFGLSLILAGFFEFMGLAMIIGAYVMGLALSRTDLKHMIQETLSPVYTFLVPVFFCVMGMMVDVSQLCSAPVLLFGAIYTVLAVAAKILGCMVPSLCCGFNVLGGLRVGAGMVPRGEVALIIAGIGLSSKYLTQEIFGIGILMTLVTTVFAPPALVALFKPKARGVRHPKANHTGSREICFEMEARDIADYVTTKLVAEFRDEGFFTSLLSKEDNIWEIAMDDMEISVRRDGRRILIQCTPEEEAMVMTAWMEVASKVNDLARSISKPMRRDDLDKLLKDTEKAKKGAGRNMLRYLQGFVMLPGFRAATKKEAIERIVGAIAKECPNHVTDVDAAIAAVMRREASMSTGLDHGIAVPHGRDPSIRGVVGAVAIVDNSGAGEGGCISDYNTIDGTPVDVIVLTIANDQSQTPYLQLMANISRVLRVDDGYAKLAKCKTSQEMKMFFRNAK
jgi:Kef-type K+ transport system membrane component KefB/mannitol/fructose-specific phosphotransferase system IIA component (Ntr-type)